MACDPSWNKIEEFESNLKDDSELSDIDTAVIGPGYTSCCLPSDGSKSLLPFEATLSNGDLLIMVGYVWHNK
jgi:hypothetical protein